MLLQALMKDAEIKVEEKVTRRGWSNVREEGKEGTWH